MRGRKSGGRIRALCAASVVGALLGVFAQAASAAPAELQVGSRTLRLCQEEPIVAYCGRLSVPLDRGVYKRPQIGIAFKWYPAGNGEATKALGTVVPVEGGPGYPSIESVEEGYEPMYGKLLKTRNML
ncbi:MAG TPA: hypothetical protein VH025_05545, partial [Solirubrobacteraceae bacterium]|nr:hypothetical protein [Solirubrobacteraceae bacterium]